MSLAQISQKWISIASASTVILIWAVATESGWTDPDFIPSPSYLAAAFVTLLTKGYGGTSLFGHVGMSLFRAFTGFTLSLIVGIPLGLLIGRSRVIEAITAPIIGFFRPIPPIAFITLFIYYFGIGEGPKIGLIFMACLWYVILNTADGVRAIPELYLRAGENIGLNRFQMFTRVMVPGAMPSIMTAVRAASAISWTLVVASELIGAQAGLGFLILDSAQYFNISVTYIGIVLIGLIGLTWELAITRIQRRILHWQGK